jgi:cytochrome c-type biogenesis protein CcmH/NrfG
MGLLSSRRISRAIDIAYDTLDGDKDTPFAVMDELDDDERLPAFLGLAERLIDEEAYDHARLAVERALALAPDSWDALGLLVQAERHDPERQPQAIAALRRLLAADPGNAEVAADLAMLLVENEQAEEALKLLGGLEDHHHPVVALRTGEALVALGRQEEALTALTEVRDLYDYRLKHGMLQGDAYEMREHMMQAARLFQEIQAEMHGREAVVLEPDRKGQLDAGEGVNFELLGQSLMADSPRIARELELESPEATIAAAETRLMSDPKDAGALALFGSGLLRLGETGKARSRFEAACAADRKCFAGYLGLGAVINYDRYELVGAAEGLPPPPAEVEVAAVVPDWSALTDLERRVIWASVQPLRGVLPALARAGVRVRILPIDVRPTDLEELRDAAGIRTTDHRAPATLGGLATPTLAVAKIEGLLDVETPAGWTFAHEFAHLAHPHLPADVREPVAALYARAREAGWVSDEHQLENDAEFLAVAYTDFLRQRHGLTEYREPDEVGVYHDVMALFADLAERKTLGG